MSRSSTGYPNVTHATLQALLNVIERMGQREGCQPPSHDVQRSALEIFNRPVASRGVTVNSARAIVYKVQGSQPQPYLVVLYVQARARTMEQIEAGDVHDAEHIIDAECSCPATTVCKHLLVALTDAERNGLHLAV